MLPKVELQQTTCIILKVKVFIVESVRPLVPNSFNIISLKLSRKKMNYGQFAQGILMTLDR